MRRLGRKYLAILAAGAGGAALAVLGALARIDVLTVLGFALALVCVLIALGWQRLDLVRSRATSVESVARLSSDPAASAGIADQVRTQQRIIEETRLIGENTREAIEVRLAAHMRAVAAQQTATIQLFQQHTPPTAVPPAEHVEPAQVLALLDVLRSRRPARVLLIGLGSTVAWTGPVVAEHGGTIVAVEPERTPHVEDPEGSRDAASGKSPAEAVQALVRAQGLTTTVEVHSAGLAVPDAPHAILPWFDLSGLGLDARFDLVVVAVPSGPGNRAALPALPILAAALRKDGAVAVLEPGPTRPVSHAWKAAPEWSADGASGTVCTLVRVGE